MVFFFFFNPKGKRKGTEWGEKETRRKKGNKEKRKQGKPQEGDALGGPCCPALLTQGSCYHTWTPGFGFSMSLEHCRAARDAS